MKTLNMARQCDIRQLIEHAGHALLAACVGLTVAGPALGQADVDPGQGGEEEEVRRYTVELIVFEYTNSALAGNEQFLPHAPPVDEQLEPGAPLTFGDPGAFVQPDLPVAIDEASEANPPASLRQEESPVQQELEELPSHIIQTQLEVLDPQEHAMKEIYSKLESLDAYRPIMRAAWTQVTHEKEQSLPIRLRRLGNAPLRLDGTVMLYLSRYLHLVVDLTIEPRGQQPAYRNDDRTRYYGDRRSSDRYGLSYEHEPKPVTYTISEDRIFRNGELRYYDHPKFGVLARVTRVEEEIPETDEMFLLPAETVGGASAPN